MTSLGFFLLGHFKRNHKSKKFLAILSLFRPLNREIVVLPYSDGQEDLHVKKVIFDYFVTKNYDALKRNIDR